MYSSTPLSSNTMVGEFCRTCALGFLFIRFFHYGLGLEPGLGPGCRFSGCSSTLIFETEARLLKRWSGSKSGPFLSFSDTTPSLHAVPDTITYSNVVQLIYVVMCYLKVHYNMRHDIPIITVRKGDVLEYVGSHKKLLQRF